MLSNFHITLEEEEWGELNYTGWEYSAWCSFVYCNRMRKYYHKLTPAKKIKKHHGFYDFITRITKEDGLDIEPRFVEKCVLFMKGRKSVFSCVIYSVALSWPTKKYVGGPTKKKYVK